MAGPTRIRYIGSFPQSLAGFGVLAQGDEIAVEDGALAADLLRRTEYFEAIDTAGPVPAEPEE